MSDEPYTRLHPNTRLVWMINGLIGVCVMMVIGGIAEISVARSRETPFPWPTIVPVLTLSIGLSLAIGSVVMAALRFAAFGYLLREADLVVKSGVLWRVRRCVPRARVQHVDIASGPIDRSFGLVDVSLYVAGGMGAVAQISGLSPEAAEQLKEALIVERTDGV